MGSLLLLLQLSAVQTFIAHKAVGVIEKQTKARISIGKIAIRFFDSVQLENIYLKDSQQDTLLYAGKLKVDINLFNLIYKKVKLDQVLLQDVVFNLKQNPDADFNFQHLIDAFSSGSPPKEKKQTGNWQFAVNNLNLENIKTIIDLEPSGFYLKGHIGILSTGADKLDFVKNEIGLTHIQLDQTDIAMILSPKNTGDTAVTAKNATPNTYLLPDIGWVFSSRSIDFRDNRVSLDDESKPTQEKGFDPLHFKLSGISLQIKNVLFGKHVAKGDIKSLEVADKCGIQLKDLRGDVLIDTTGINVKKLFLETGNSHIEADLEALFPKLESLVQLDNQLRLHADFKESKIAGNDVSMFIPEQADKLLNDLGIVYLDGAINGTINDLAGSNFIVSIDDQNNLDMNFHITGLPQIDRTYFDLDINRVAVTSGMITRVSGTELPVELQRLGAINLTGKYRGTIHKMQFTGTLSTKFGSLSSDLNAHFNQDYTSANYSGNIQLNEFQLGSLLNDTTIGAITLEASIEGSGLSLDDIQADFQTSINEIGYKNYTYTNLSLEGNIADKRFTGSGLIDDPNLRLDLKGLFNLKGPTPQFHIEASLDTVNLGELNIMTASIGASANIEVDFQGTGVDDIIGFVLIKDIHASSDTIYAHLDSIKAVAQQLESGDKRVELLSPILYGKLEGNYKMSTLPLLIADYVNKYFPTEKATEAIGNQTIPDQQFEILVTLSKPLSLLQVFVPQLISLDTVYMKGTIDNQRKSLGFTALLPAIEYDNIKVDSIKVNMSGDESDLAVSIVVDTVNYSDKVKIPIAFNALLHDNKMDFALKIEEDSLSRLEIAGLVAQAENKSYRLSFKDDLSLNGEKWNIPADSYIDIRPDYFSVSNFILKNGEQQIGINSRLESKGMPLDISISQFEIAELSDMINYDSVSFDGTVNGQLTVDNPKGYTAFSSDLDINSIAINQRPVGDLHLSAAWVGSSVAIELQLKGEHNDVDLAGEWIPERGMIDLKLDLKRLNLAVADPLLSNFIRDSKGYLSADIDIQGQILAPEIKGFIAFHDVSTMAVIANSRFTLPDKNRIDISSGKFELNRFEILDQDNRKAVLQGSIAHQDFQNFKMDLSLKTDEFLFMNTTEKENEAFYGKVIMAINGKVKGDPMLPKVEGSATAKSGTQVFINPFSGEEAIRQADYIVFGRPPENDDQEVDSTLVEQEYSVKISGVDMNLLFNLTPEAELQIIIDPASGDKLTCRGSADLVVDISPAGGTQINGSYIVESGSYSFSYQGMMKRQFAVQKDSRINFRGDPMDATLNITAIHELNASTYELISEQAASLGENEIAAAKKRIPVQVLLKIGGQISKPEISFDIRLLSISDPVSSMASRQLAQIRQNPAEMNKQAFGLILFKSFIAESGNSQLEGAGASMVLSSVSNLINSQLNQLTNRVEGFEINLDVESYMTTNVVTEVQLDISKQLLNDRLEIKLGGGVGVESGESKSAFTGDFVVEYKLTENGRYRAKIFQTSEYDELSTSNLFRTGVGITFNESFRQLLQRRKEEDREKKLELKEQNKKN